MLFPIEIPYVSAACQMCVVCACVLILVDVVTGIVGAIKNHETKSAIMRHGLGHKSGELVCIFVGVVFEVATQAAQVPLPTGSTVCVYVMIMEAISILENMAKINPDFKDSRVYKALKGDLDDSESA